MIKEMSQEFSAPPQQQRKNHREAGLFSATCLIVGNLIGTGAFMLPAAMAPLGIIGLMGWGVSTAGALCLALIFAILARHIPAAGGIYAYSRTAFGDYVGFQVAWNYWIATWTGNAAFLVSIPAYLSILWPPLKTDPTLSLMVSLGILWGIVGLHCLGVKQASFIQNVSTVLKLIPLIMIPLVGIFFIQAENFHWEEPLRNFSFSKGLGEATILTIWTFIGIESATIPAQAIKNPEKTIPRATLLGTLISASVYILGAITILGVVGPDLLVKSEAPYALAAGKIFTSFPTHWIEFFVALGAVISGVGCLNGWILLQAQMPLAVAQDGLFPRLFARGIYKGTPILGLVFSSVLVTILLFMSQSNSLIDQYILIVKLSTFCMLVCYLYPTVAVLLVFKHMARRDYLKRLMLLILGCTYLVWAMIGAGQETVFLGALLFFGSTPIYYWVKKARKEVKFS